MKKNYSSLAIAMLILNIATLPFLAKANPIQPINDVTLSGSSCLDGSALTFQTNVTIASIQWFKDGVSLPASVNYSTVAGGNGVGTASNQLQYANGIFVTPNNDIYIADASNHRILKWSIGATSGIIVAGGNGPGNAANQLNLPQDVFVDANGNLFIADKSNHRIQKWAPGATSGVTVAGGNGIGNTSNKFNNPYGIYVDNVGNIYVADINNHRVQKWAPGATSGVTVAGGNGQGLGNNQLNSPIDIFVKSNGDLYILDRNNQRVQKWTAGATSGVTVAGGNGQGPAANQFYLPFGLTIDENNNIFVADTYNHRIQKWAAGATAGITLSNGSGSTPNKVNLPYSVALDAFKNLYISDTYNFRVQKYLLDNKSYYPTTVGTYSVQVTDVNGVIYTSNNFQINAKPAAVISGTNVLCLGKSTTLTASGGVNYIWNTGETNAAININPTVATIYNVTVTDINGCSATANKNISISSVNATISSANSTCAGATTSLTANGGTSYVWNTGVTTAKLSVTIFTPTTYSVTVTNINACTAVATQNLTVLSSSDISISGSACIDGTPIVATAADTSNRLIWYKDGKYLTNVNTYTHSIVAGQIGNSQSLSYPQGIFVDAAENVYVADSYNHRVQKFAPGATSGITVAGGNGEGGAANQLYYPNDVFVDATGNVYVSDNYNHRIQKWSPGATSGVTVAGGNGNGSAANQLYNPSSIFVDNFGAIYISDHSNARVQKWSLGATSGITLASNLSSPIGIFVDSNNDLYITLYYDHSVQKWPVGASSGVVVVGGNGAGTAENQLYYPYDCFIDNNGNGYVIDDFGIHSFNANSTNSTLIISGIGYTPGFAVDEKDNLFYSAYYQNCVKKAAPNKVTQYTPTESGTYTVVARNTSGCTKSSNSIIKSPNAKITGLTEICKGDILTLTASGGTNYLWNTGQTTVVIMPSPTQNITYTVTVTDGMGCSLTVSHSVIVKELPFVSIYGDTLICAGQTTTLYTNGGSNYTWNTGDNNYYLYVTPIYPTTYSVTATNSYGCKATASHTVNTILLNSATISSSSKDTICQGETVNLSVSCGMSYQWSNENTNNTIYVAPLQTTTYVVTVTNALGAKFTASKTIYVNAVPIVSLNGSPCLDSTALTLTSNCPTCKTEWFKDEVRISESTLIASNLQTINAMFADHLGNVYTTDYYSHKILKWTPGATTPTVFAVGTGPTSFSYPIDIFVDTAENVYLICENSDKVIKWAPNSTNGVIVAGGNGFGSATNQLNCPKGMFVATNGDLYIADFYNHRIQKWAAGASSGVTVAGGNGNGSATNQLRNPTDVALDQQGNIYIVDYANNRIQKWAAGASSGTTLLNISNPTQISVSDKNEIYYSGWYSPLMKWQLAQSSPIKIATGISQFAIDKNGDVYVFNNNYEINKLKAVTTNTYTPKEAGTYYAMQSNSYGCASISNSKIISIIPTVSISTSTTTPCAGTSIKLTGNGNGSYQWNTGEYYSDIYASPIYPTTYSLTVTTYSGCSRNASLTINPILSTSATISSNKDTVCQGETITLIANCGINYQWSEGSIGSYYMSVSPSQTTTYTVTVTNALGAKFTANKTIYVSVTPTLSLNGSACLDSTALTITSNCPTCKTEWFKNDSRINESTTIASNIQKPSAMFVDHLDNLYIAEYYSKRILKWAPGATSPTVIINGNISNAFSNPIDIFVDTSENIYLICEGSNQVIKWLPNATSGIIVAGGNGAGDAANQLNNPTDIFVASNGDMYISDNYNHRIQKWAVGATSGVTVAGGNGSGYNTNQLKYPKDISFDKQGNLFINDYGNYRVQKWPVNATSGSNFLNLSYLSQININKEGELTCIYGNQVIRWHPSLNRFVNIASNIDMFSYGKNGDLYASEINTYSIKKIKPILTNAYVPKEIGTYFAMQTNDSGCSGTTNSKAIDKIPNASISVSNFTPCAGQSITLSSNSYGNYLWSTGSTGYYMYETPVYPTTYSLTVTTSSGCSRSSSVTINPIIFTTAAISSNKDTICQGETINLSTNCGTNYQWSEGSTTQSISLTPLQTTTYTVTLTNALGAKFTASKTIYVNTVPILSLSGSTCLDSTALTITSNCPTCKTEWYKDGVRINESTTVAFGNGWGSGNSQLQNISDVFIDHLGNVYIAEQTNHRILKWAPSATSATVIAMNGGVPSILFPTAIFVDLAENVYVINRYGNEVIKYSPNAMSGVIVAGGNGNGYAANQLSISESFYVAANGDIYIADTYNHRIQKWSVGATSGVTVAGGNGNGSAANQLSSPKDLAFDKQGNLYIADTYNNRVQKWASGATSGVTVFSNIYVNKIKINNKNEFFYSDGNKVRKWEPSQNRFIVVSQNVKAFAFDKNGDLYVGNYGTDDIKKLTPISTNTFIPKEIGTYNAIQTNATGCSGITNSKTINPTPTASITTPTITPCAGQNFTLTGNGAVSYLWSTGATTNSIAVNSIYPTTYILTVTNSYNCPNKTEVTVNPILLTTATIEGSTSICKGQSATLTASCGQFYQWSSGGTTQEIYVSPSQTTTYTLTVTNALGNTMLASHTLIVNDLPDITLTGSKCLDSTALVVSSKNNIALNDITWLIGYEELSTEKGLSYIPKTTGSYRVKNISVDGCESFSNPISVYYIPKPSISGLTTPCAGQYTNLYVSGGNSYLWSDNSTSTYISVNPTYSTTYSVTATNPGGCAGTTSIKINPILLTSATISGVTSICEGQTARLTVSCGKSYQWNTGHIGDYIDVNPSQTTTYSVTVTNALNDIMVASHTLTVNSFPEITLNVPSPCLNDSLPMTYTTNDPNNRIEWYLNNERISKTLKVAGGNSNGSGNNELNSPNGIFVDNSDNIYIADVQNHRIQKWAKGATSGITVAGGNGQGNAANQLNSPKDVFVDNSGNIYVSDANNHRIQKWEIGATSGITVAGGNGHGSTADKLFLPSGIYVDTDGTIYIADANNHRVQKWGKGATSGVTVAGGGGYGQSSDRLAYPSDVFLDANKNIYVADNINFRVQKWAPNSYYGTTVISSDHISNLITNIFVDSNEDIYVADGYSVRKWKKDSYYGDYVGQFNNPRGIFIRNNADIYISSANYGNVYLNTPIQTTSLVLTQAGNYSLVATSAGGCSTTSNIKNIDTKPSISIQGPIVSCPGEYVDLSVESNWSNLGNYYYLWSNGSNSNSININPVTPTTYSVTVSTYGGCSTVAQHTITPLPITSASISGPNQVCQGSSITLQGSCGTSYIWSTGQTTQSIIVSPTQSTTYSVTITPILGASSVASQFVSVGTLPTVSLTGSTCTNGTAFNYTTNDVNNNIDWLKDDVAVATITTVAGGNGLGENSNQFNTPTDVYVDANDNVYVCDFLNHRIQKWLPNAKNGITVAGGNGAGNAANQLNYPLGVQVMPNGDMYIADRENYRIQKWAAGASSGVTVAGGNGRGNAANQIDYAFNVFVDSLENIYIADTWNHRIQKWAAGASSGVTVAGGNGSGNGAHQFNCPADIAVDTNGDMYIADRNNNRIQKWKAGSSTGETFVDWNSGFTNAPRAVFIDKYKNLYITNQENGFIEKWNINSKNQIIVADNLSEARSSFVDNNGKLYVSDYRNNRIQKYDFVKGNAYIPTLGGNYSVVATNSSGCTARSNFISVQSYSNNLSIYGGQKICLGENTQLTAYNPSTDLTYLWDNGATTQNIRVSPTVATTYSLTVSDNQGCKGFKSFSVEVVPQPTIIIAAQQCQSDSLNLPYVVSKSADVTKTEWYKDGKLITPFNTNNSNSIVYEISTVAGSGGQGAGLNQLNVPRGNCVDINENVYVADYNNNRIVKWAKGATSGTVVANTDAPFDVAVDTSGSIYVVEYWNHQVLKWTKGATVGVVVAGGNGAGAAANQLSEPTNILLDADENMYISDRGNNRIQKWMKGATSGITVAGGNGQGTNANQLLYPEGIFIDGNANIYIAEPNAKRIQKWAKNATSGTTVVGAGVTAPLNYPTEVFVDSQGKITIVESFANQVVVFDTLTKVSSVIIPDTETAHWASFASNGDIYISQTNSSVKKYTKTNLNATFPTAYVAKVTNSIGCSAWSNAVTIKAKPKVSISTTACLDGVTPFTLTTDSIPTSINWYKNGNAIATGSSYVPLTNGDYTCVVSYNSGCSATSNHIILNDTIAPIFDLYSLPSDLTLNCNDPIPNEADVTALDNCSDVNISFQETNSKSLNNTSCASYAYGITRIWTASDFVGNVSYFTQKIIFIDNEPPVLSAAPANVTLNSTSVPPPATLTATDNCSTANVVFSESIEKLTPPPCYSYNYKITRVWTATDACGNTSSTSQIINSLGEVLLTCPADKTLNTNDDGTNNYNCTVNILASHQLSPVFADVCNLSSVMKFSVSGATTINGNGAISGTALNKGINNVNYTVIKNNTTQTCSFKVTVLDNELPKITLPSATVVFDACQFPSTIPAANNAVATDNCSTPTLTILSDVTSDLTNCATQQPMLKYTKLLTRTWKATDVSGNTNTAVQKIYLRDMVAPKAICKNATALIGNSNISFAAANLNNGSSDNCSAALNFSICSGANCTNFASTITLTKSMIPAGQTQLVLPVRLRVMDACNNISYCNANLTLKKVTTQGVDNPSNTISPNDNIADNQPLEASGILTEHGSMRCFPNPFAEDLNIQYNLRQEVENVVLKVYDNQGKMVAILNQSEQKMGFYSLRWNLNDLPSGLYHICLELNGKCEKIERVVLLK